MCRAAEQIASNHVTPVVQPRYARLSRMRKLLKPFVLWLLLITVPFQGYAAAAMMCCGSAHSKGAQHAAQASTMQGSMHSHLSGMNHNHDDGGVSKRVAFKCNACASCCVGAALVQTPDYSFSVAPPNSARIAFITRYFHRFVPDNLERPPYRLIA